jgi:hypothetical protein
MAQKNFDKLLTAFLEFATKDLAEIKESNAEMTKSVGALVTENIEMRNTISSLNKRLQLSDGLVAQLKSKLSQQQEEIIDLKTRSMRDNVLIKGINEDANETWAQTKEKVKDFVENTLNVANPDSVVIDRAHRMGQKGQGPRPIVVKLLTQQSRDIMFSHAKQNIPKTSKKKVVEQLPIEVTERRKRLWPKFEAAKANPDNTVKWSLDKLVINGVSYHACDEIIEINPEIDLRNNIDVRHSDHSTIEGSTFMGHAAEIKSRNDIPAVMANVLQDRAVAGATHNIYAYRIRNGDKFIEGIKDDGEHGAGTHLLNLLREEKHENVIVVVTRWFGNKHLGLRRFDCIKDSAESALREFL